MAGGAQRRLSDLRKTRVPVKFDGEDIDGPYEIDVWVVKLNDVEYQACLAAADGAKARMLIGRGNEDSDQWNAAYGTVLGFGEDKEVLLEFLAGYHVAERDLVIEAELAGAENNEWAKDNYLEGLREAWRGSEGDLGLQEAWQARTDEPDTVDPVLAAKIPEAERVFGELTRFNDEVEQRRTVERDRFMREHADEDLDVLRRRVVDRYLDAQAEEAWMKVFTRYRVYMSTREFSNRRARYFKDLAEVDDTDPLIRSRLAAAYDEIAVEGVEGKGSPGPQSSSLPSGSSGEEETSEASGPTSASA